MCVEKCGSNEEEVRFNESLAYCQRAEEKCDKFVALVDGKFSCVDSCGVSAFIIDENRCNATCDRYIDAQNTSVCVNSCASTYFKQTEAGK